jgi:hypothetical protein
MNCNSSNAPVATRQALQLQLFIALQLQLSKQSSCNTTSTLIATLQKALQLQLLKNTSIATRQALQFATP